MDGAYWTLAVEISFYGLVFLTLVFRRFSLLPWLAVVLTAASGQYTTAHMLVLLKWAPDTALLHGLADAGLPGYLALVLAIVIVLAAVFPVALLVELAVRNLLKSALSEVGRWAAGIRPFGFMFRPSDTIWPGYLDNRPASDQRTLEQGG